MNCLVECVKELRSICVEFIDFSHIIQHTTYPLISYNIREYEPPGKTLTLPPSLLTHYLISANEQEALTLKNASLPRVKVTATVIFSILNSYARRAQRDTRVIGTLLGEVKEGVVTVSGIISRCLSLVSSFVRSLSASLSRSQRASRSEESPSIATIIALCITSIVATTRRR